ncbi:hypothetical protein FBF32_03670 [Candidatus Saccharibacteria bacterium oral taxon 488]|nr:hypothetical protein FBF32_03670 [Candidatus Saccharibacteria bacterium oral taxon 488]QJU10404.1 hypothetical protein FBF26_04020 [Candidatus Saccharibacteria bacterium oral taxon 488]
MGKERVGGSNGNQGSMDSWKGLAAASNNDGEQQPDGTEVHEDVQGGDEVQREQEVAAPMTFDDLCRTVTAMNDVYREYNNKKGNTKPGTQRQREEILADQAERIEQAQREFDERRRIIRKATSARLQQIEESTEAARAYAQELDLVQKESSALMNEAIAPLAAADKASDEKLRQFIHDFDEQRERGELTLDDVELWYFVVAIAERNSWQRKNVLRTSADLESEEAAPWEVKVGEKSPVAYATNDREALSGSRRRAALQLPLGILRRNKDVIEGYIRGVLEPYAREGIISSRYSVHVDEESYYDGVHIREVRIESNCGGFVLSEGTTNQPDS